MEIHDHLSSLRMALVEKDSVHLLESDWDRSGVYLLLDGVAADSTFGVYVGKAPSGIRSRLLDHERKKTWARALLIQRDNQHGLNSAHIGWLEGDLYDLFNAAERARLHNGPRTGDQTVPSYDLRILESFRDPIVRVLRLLGYDPAAADESAVSAASAKKSATYYGVGLADLLAAGLIKVGDQLSSANGAWPADAEISATGILHNGTDYPSPSTAAAAVKGGAANGWDFWAVQTSTGSKRLSAIRADYRQSQQTIVPGPGASNAAKP